MKFDGPIPGQSLTTQPKNYPWERPPETSDPDEAIVHHLTRLAQPKVMDRVLDAVTAGLPVSMVTELVLTGAVAKGIHSIDISMMIAPVVHDYLVNLLEEEKVEYKEFFDDEEDGSIQENLAASQAIAGLKEKGMTSVEEEPMEEEPVVEEKPKRGLMSREVSL